MSEKLIGCKEGKKLEILAPCGGEESVRAAVFCGADAVYLGGKAFHARKSTVAFSDEMLYQVVRFCHLYGVKVYQTLNTLVFDRELDTLREVIKAGCEAGIDAFIIQDMGVLKLVQAMAPDMRIHASTQMSVHTPSGVRLLEQLGVKRAVLARELSIDEIREIRAATTMELEVFVHGALCVSMSGQCYMSGMLGGRSGNRGCCAQPCRLPFSACNRGAADLSLKDLSAVTMMKELALAGVSSLKIEGRMKRPEYVAAAVTACVQQRDGMVPDLDNLRSVFSRSGFTNGYLTDKRDGRMFGVREKEDVEAASPVLKPLQALYHKEKQRIGCTASFQIRAGQHAVFEMKDADGHIALAKGPVPEPAREKPTTLESVRESFQKLGGTPFYLERLEGDIENGLTLPVRERNAMRRHCVEQLTQMRQTMFPIPFINRPLLWPKECQKQSQTLRIRLESLAQLSAVEAFEGEMILPMREILKSDRDWSNFLVTAELPRAMFGREKQLIDGLRRLQECGIKKLLIQNLGQILPAKEMGFCLSGGFGLNITNSYSLLFYREQGLTDLTISFETNLEDIRRLKRLVPIGGIVYGKLPLMLTRSCPFWKYRQCSSCSKEGILTDRQGKQFSVRCHDGVREIYNPDLLYLADRKKELSCFDFLTLYFTDENAAEIATVVFEYQTGVGKREKLTRGLYYRKI